MFVDENFTFCGSWSETGRCKVAADADEIVKLGIALRVLFEDLGYEI